MMSKRQMTEQEYIDFGNELYRQGYELPDKIQEILRRNNHYAPVTLTYDPLEDDIDMYPMPSTIKQLVQLYLAFESGL